VGAGGALLLVVALVVDVVVATRAGRAGCADPLEPAQPLVTATPAKATRIHRLATDIFTSRTPQRLRVLRRR
jgi:hypothetical protein